MLVDHRPLNRVQAAIIRRQAFNRDEFFTIQSRQELNTGIDCTNYQFVTIMV